MKAVIDTCYYVLYTHTHRKHRRHGHKRNYIIGLYTFRVCVCVCVCICVYCVYGERMCLYSCVCHCVSLMPSLTKKYNPLCNCRVHFKISRKIFATNLIHKFEGFYKSCSFLAQNLTKDVTNYPIRSHKQPRIRPAVHTEKTNDLFISFPGLVLFRTGDKARSQQGNSEPFSFLLMTSFIQSSTCFHHECQSVFCNDITTDSLPVSRVMLVSLIVVRSQSCNMFSVIYLPWLISA